MGEGRDFTCDTPEDVACCTEAAKEMADLYESLAYLQWEFMDRYEELEPNVFQITYSGGSRIIVDYNTMSYRLIKSL